MLNTLIQYCNIMLDIEGNENALCLQGEIESGSLSNYFKEK